MNNQPMTEGERKATSIALPVLLRIGGLAILGVRLVQGRPPSPPGA